MTEADPFAALAGRHRREKWRRGWIDRFRERQRAARKWIEFSEISGWCAQSNAVTRAEEEKQAFDLACQRLSESMLRGEFEVAARSKVLYLDPKVLGVGTAPHRLTRDWFAAACRSAARFDQHFRLTVLEGAFSVPLIILANCWIPADMARNWLSIHGYRLPPYLLPTSSGSKRSANTSLMGPVVQRMVAALGKPGRDVAWGEFCRRVRKECDVSERDPPRGYGDKSIKRQVGALQGVPESGTPRA